nr:thiamine pyrophosphate-dependent enzyme [Cutibacterium avidum]
MCLASGWGHVGGCSSAVELLTALYFGGVLRYAPGDPHAAGRDRVLVRGHIGPTRYVIFSLLGWVADDELDRHARLGSRLQGHETRSTPGVDFGPSGSLGMSLSYGAGSALAAERSGRSPWTTYVILGDGEEQEGNVAEAARHIAAAGLTNIVVVVDKNGKQLAGPTLEADAADLAGTWRGYGWTVTRCEDGNDVLAIRDCLRQASRDAATGPVMVIAETQKGKGVTGADLHYSGVHELGHVDSKVIQQSIGELLTSRPRKLVAGSSITTRRKEVDLPVLAAPEDFGWARDADGFQLQVLSMLASSWRSSHCDAPLYFLYADTFPTPLLERTGLASAAMCLNVGIREQHLVSLAHGLSIADPGAVIVLHTVDAFLLRAADQIFCAAEEAGVNFILIGDDAGISNSRNGATHQSSVQALFMHSLSGVHCFEPANGPQLADSINGALQRGGVSYIRVHDGAAPADERSTPCSKDLSADVGETRPDVLLVACGLMIGPVTGALDRLSMRGISACCLSVVDFDCDPPSCLPKVPAVLVYDGHPQVLRDWLARSDPWPERPVASIGYVHGTSGTTDELMQWAGLDPCSISNVAIDLLARSGDRSDL